MYLYQLGKLLASNLESSLFPGIDCEVCGDFCFLTAKSQRATEIYRELISVNDRHYVKANGFSLPSSFIEVKTTIQNLEQSGYPSTFHDSNDVESVSFFMKSILNCNQMLK